MLYTEFTIVLSQISSMQGKAVKCILKKSHNRNLFFSSELILTLQASNTFSILIMHCLYVLVKKGALKTGYWKQDRKIETNYDSELLPSCTLKKDVCPHEDVEKCHSIPWFYCFSEFIYELKWNLYSTLTGTATKKHDFRMIHVFVRKL